MSGGGARAEAPRKNPEGKPFFFLGFCRRKTSQEDQSRGKRRRRRRCVGGKRDFGAQAFGGRAGGTKAPVPRSLAGPPPPPTSESERKQNQPGAIPIFVVLFSKLQTDHVRTGTDERSLRTERVCVSPTLHSLGFRRLVPRASRERRATRPKGGGGRPSLPQQTPLRHKRPWRAQQFSYFSLRALTDHRISGGGGISHMAPP